MSHVARVPLTRLFSSSESNDSAVGDGKKSAWIIMDWTQGIGLTSVLLFYLGWIGGKCVLYVVGFCVDPTSCADA